MKRAIIAAHFDPDAIVDPHFLHALRAWRRHCDTLILVSTASIDSEDAELCACCDRIVVRPNEGYDFASWQRGVAQLDDLDAYDEILFINDSLYGPFGDLDALFRRTESFMAPFWGITRSHQERTHLQSYCFAFRRALIENGLFTEFWSSVRAEGAKRDIIKRYELGLSALLAERGIATDALLDPARLDWREKVIALWRNGPVVRSKSRSRRRRFRQWREQRRLLALNPTHVYWRTLLERDFPFIKVELMRNREILLDRRYVEAELARRDANVLTLLRAHLARTSDRYSGDRFVGKQA